MNNRTRKPSRSSCHGLVTEIQHRIVTGRYRPGTRLPTRENWLTHFGGSKATLQKAVDHLVEIGFLETHGCAGTFVAAHPPNLCYYGLVFPDVPGGHKHWGPYFDAVCRQGENMEKREHVKFPVFYVTERGSSVGDFEELVGQVRSFRLAGIFLFAHPDIVSGAMGELSRVPVVAMLDLASESNLPRVVLDWQGFMTRAIETLVVRGKKRLAVLTVPYSSEGCLRHMQSALSSSGAVCPPSRVLEVGPSPWNIRQTVHLLTELPRDERPEGLIVTSDSLLEPAAEALAESGIGVPHDVEVIAHTSFPCPSRSVVPVLRLGFDVEEVLQTAIGIVGLLRNNEAVAPRTAIPARFEHELASSMTGRFGPEENSREKGM